MTAARPGEVVKAVWDEIDLDKAVWIIPGERMKAQKEHRVPLSEPAVALLRKMQEIRVSMFIFPGQGNQRPLWTDSFRRVLERMGRSDLTAHGFRSTFRDWAAECTSFPREVAELALAHSIGDKVEAAYRRGDLIAKRHALMQAWAGYIAGDDSKVVAINSAS